MKDQLYEVLNKPYYDENKTYNKGDVVIKHVDMFSVAVFESQIDNNTSEIKSKNWKKLYNLNDKLKSMCS